MPGIRWDEANLTQDDKKRFSVESDGSLGVPFKQEDTSRVFNGGKPFTVKIGEAEAIKISGEDALSSNQSLVEHLSPVMGEQSAKNLIKIYGVDPLGGVVIDVFNNTLDNFSVGFPELKTTKNIEIFKENLESEDFKIKITFTGLLLKSGASGKEQKIPGKFEYTIHSKYDEKIGKYIQYMSPVEFSDDDGTLEKIFTGKITNDEFLKAYPGVVDAEYFKNFVTQKQDKTNSTYFNLEACAELNKLFGDYQNYKDDTITTVIYRQMRIVSMGGELSNDKLKLLFHIVTFCNKDQSYRDLNYERFIKDMEVALKPFELGDEDLKIDVILNSIEKHKNNPKQLTTESFSFPKKVRVQQPQPQPPQQAQAQAQAQAQEQKPTQPETVTNEPGAFAKFLGAIGSMFATFFRGSWDILKFIIGIGESEVKAPPAVEANLPSQYAEDMSEDEALDFAIKEVLGEKPDFQHIEAVIERSELKLPTISPEELAFLNPRKKIEPKNPASPTINERTLYALAVHPKTSKEQCQNLMKKMSLKEPTAQEVTDHNLDSNRKRILFSLSQRAQTIANKAVGNTELSEAANKVSQQLAKLDTQQHKQSAKQEVQQQQQPPIVEQQLPIVEQQPPIVEQQPQVLFQKINVQKRKELKQDSSYKNLTSSQAIEALANAKDLNIEFVIMDNVYQEAKEGSLDHINQMIQGYNDLKVAVNNDPLKVGFIETILENLTKIREEKINEQDTEIISSLTSDEISVENTVSPVSQSTSENVQPSEDAKTALIKVKNELESSRSFISQHIKGKKNPRSSSKIASYAVSDIININSKIKLIEKHIEVENRNPTKEENEFITEAKNYIKEIYTEYVKIQPPSEKENVSLDIDDELEKFITEKTAYSKNIAIIKNYISEAQKVKQNPEVNQDKLNEYKQQAKNVIEETGLITEAQCNNLINITTSKTLDQTLDTFVQINQKTAAPERPVIADAVGVYGAAQQSKQPPRFDKPIHGNDLNNLSHLDLAAGHKTNEEKAVPGMRKSLKF